MLFWLELSEKYNFFVFIGYFTQALVYQGLLLIPVFEMTYVRKQNVKK